MWNDLFRRYTKSPQVIKSVPLGADWTGTILNRKYNPRERLTMDMQEITADVLANNLTVVDPATGEVENAHLGPDPAPDTDTCELRRDVFETDEAHNRDERYPQEGPDDLPPVTREELLALCPKADASILSVFRTFAMNLPMLRRKTGNVTASGSHVTTTSPATYLDEEAHGAWAKAWERRTPEDQLALDLSTVMHTVQITRPDGRRSSIQVIWIHSTECQCTNMEDPTDPVEARMLGLKCNSDGLPYHSWTPVAHSDWIMGDGAADVEDPRKHVTLPARYWIETMKWAEVIAEDIADPFGSMPEPIGMESF